ncbi:MAG TPA: hypothetical protein PL085_11745 [Agriterribacter sp.]|uniref:DUF7833 domain-containing protein n=1 Tax=Agriterribacter sp. TaxID=2821509 RepID=UPI002C4A78F2|nr:hypothetical protein [Agriterribacter sp.]HRQ17742.1 hypothetical protein [Agriterribacter sp.]
MPYEFHTVTKSLAELVDEKVLSVEGDMLIQKRMVKDNEISEIRAAAGKKGGDKNASNSKNFAKANAKAKMEANSVIVNEDCIPVWENEKLSFKNSGDWIFKMCRQHDVALEWMDRAIDAFLMELELKEDYKDVKELKRHFVNWLNLKKEKYMPEQKRMVV